MPNFEVRTEEADRIAGSELLLFAPIVPFSEKKQWEAYVKEERESIRSQEVRAHM
jgi:hypothetical protein